MTIDSQTRGMQIVGDGERTHVLDVHCGRCAACRASLDFWCLDPRHDGERLLSLATRVSTDHVQRWLAALAALATTTPASDAVLLVLEEVDADAATELVRPWHSGPVLASPDGRDEMTRSHLAELSATGRAQTVLTLHEARTAVRAVQRGGQVCLPDVVVDAPSVTELVQRDVKLVGAQRIRDLVVTTSWSDLGSSLEPVLNSDAVSVRTGR
jgi:hypothetical protein